MTVSYNTVIQVVVSFFLFFLGDIPISPAPQAAMAMGRREARIAMEKTEVCMLMARLEIKIGLTD